MNLQPLTGFVESLDVADYLEIAGVEYDDSPDFPGAQSLCVLARVANASAGNVFTIELALANQDDSDVAHRIQGVATALARFAGPGGASGDRLCSIAWEGVARRCVDLAGAGWLEGKTGTTGYRWKVGIADNGDVAVADITLHVLPLRTV
jgi:hypothetical protein